MTAAVSDIRDARGRFKPGRSGNPAGKPPGTQNWATRLKTTVDEAAIMAQTRLLIEKLVPLADAKWPKGDNWRAGRPAAA